MFTKINLNHVLNYLLSQEATIIEHRETKEPIDSSPVSSNEPIDSPMSPCVTDRVRNFKH